MLRYRLSLVLHPQVIGWAVNSMLDEKKTTLSNFGVRVFSEGREAERNGKTGISLGAQRRIARQIRKTRLRNKRRKKIVANELIRLGLLAPNKDMRMRLKNEHPECVLNSGLNQEERCKKNREWNPLYLRFKALENRLEPYELGRIIMHLCAHRGYKNNDLDSVSGQFLERKKNLQKIRELEKQILQTNSRTLGEYLWQKAKKNYLIDDEKGTKRETIRFKSDMINVFPSRSMYETEFDLIAQKQSSFFTQVNWQKLRNIIYYQRSIKISERSYCPFYINRENLKKSELRGFKMQPSAYRLKILIMLQNCFYIDSEYNRHMLTDSQKKQLYFILENQKTLSFNEAIKRLNLNGGTFLCSDTKKNKFIGNEISCDMRKKEFFGTSWDNFSEKEQDDIIEEMILQKRHMEYPVKTVLAPYSALLMRQVSAIMFQKTCGFEQAICELHLESQDSFTENSYKNLPPYGKILPEIISTNAHIQYGKTWNPTTHAVFNQVRKTVNSLIEKYGKPNEIIFHMASEVKKTREKRDFLLKKNDFRRKEIERVKQIFQKLGSPQFSRADFTAYKLWKKLAPCESIQSAHQTIKAKACPYCQKPLTLNDIAQKKAQTVFITPFSINPDITGNNLTLAHSECVVPMEFQNRHSKKIPFFAHKTPRIDFTDTGFFAQKMCKYLSAVCKKEHIKAVTPEIPKLLSASWKLHDLCAIPVQGTFADYRNYALNALILNRMDSVFIEKFKKMNAAALCVQDLKIPESSIDIDFTITKLKNMLVSYKTDHAGNGKLFDETALGKHIFYKSVSETDFKQSDIPFLHNNAIKKQTMQNRQKLGWKRAKELLFNAERNSVLVDKSAFVSRKKLLQCSLHDIERIINPQIRGKLAKLAADNSGNGFYTALEHYVHTTGIRRVRITPKGQEAVFIPSAQNKAYAVADFLFVDIWRIPHKVYAYEYKGVFVSRFESFSYKKEAKKPHPAAKFICRLYKNDALRIENNTTQSCFLRIAGFATTQQKLDIRPLSAALPIPVWNQAVAQGLKEPIWEGKKSPQNHMSINTIFSLYNNIKKVRISPMGLLKSSV